MPRDRAIELDAWTGADGGGVAAAGARDDGPDGRRRDDAASDVTGAEPQPASTSAIATRLRPAAQRSRSRRPHASSRRITGKRSSGAATTNPRRSQNAGGAALVAFGSRADLRVRLDGGEPADREVVAHGLDEHRREARGRAPRAVVAMQVITAGSGESGRRGYSSRVRSARG